MVALRKISVGERFGSLTVVSAAPRDKDNHLCWNCLCVCGNTVVRKHLRLLFSKDRRRNSNCGCLEAKRIVALGHGNKTHGLSTLNSEHPLLYYVWKSMVARCENKKHPAFRSYGAKGVKVCGAWHDPLVFVKWAINSGYQEGLSIERRNSCGNYSPRNCTWLPMSLQHGNKRKNVMYTYQGRTLCLSEWARYIGMSHSALDKRRSLGLPIHLILSKESLFHGRNPARLLVQKEADRTGKARAK